jgi:hypothetical protein
MLYLQGHGVPYSPKKAEELYYKICTPTAGTYCASWYDLLLHSPPR